MGFPPLDQAPARLNRRALAVPGGQTQRFAKAALGADVIFLDLGDAAAPEERLQAHRAIIRPLNEIDRGKKTVALRIIGPNIPFMYRDAAGVVEEAGARLDAIVIPKVGTAADVHAVDVMLMQVEDARGHRKRIGFGHIVETAPGMQNIGGIAAASRRNESLQSGVADCAARANRLRPIDGPSGDLSDPGNCKAAARRAAVLGCEGKWALPPGQVAPANEAMSPSAAEVERARCNLQALAQVKAQGKGAALPDGRLIDHASVRRAEVLGRNAHQIAA